MTVEALRTPDDRFVGLKDFPFAPTYVEDLPGYEGLRAHYLDLGPRNARHTFLCLHGEPDWSYLYRRMIPVLLEGGGRVVAPDFYGFGRSDKPVRDEDYGFHFHRGFLLRLVERLDLSGVTLVAADWGGVIGLTLPVDPGFRARLERLIVMNTVLAVGRPISEAVARWRAFVAATPDLQVGAGLRQAEPIIGEAEAAAYDAPFPDAAHKAGVRAFPRLLMVEPGMEGIEESLAARRFWSQDWSGLSFMAVGARDEALGLPVMAGLRATIRGCPEPMVLPDAGHFVQEHGESIARAALQAFGDLPRRQEEPQMSTTTASDTPGAVRRVTTLDPQAGHFTIINTYEVAPERAEDLLSVLERATAEVLRHVPGFISANLHLSLDRSRVVNYAQWESREAVAAAGADPAVQARIRQAGEIAGSFKPIPFALRRSFFAAARPLTEADRDQAE